MLRFVLPFHCSSPFNFQVAFLLFCCKRCKQSSFIQCSVLTYSFVIFNVLFLFMALCLFIADSVCYANKFIRLIKNHTKVLKSLQFEKF